MNRVIDLLKKIRIGQILTAFLAGVLLIVSTACNATEVAANNPRPEVPNEAVNSSYKGGMNDFSDLDPRQKDTGAAKAKGLVDNAQKNLDKRADSPEKYVRNYQQGTPVNERTRRLGDDANSSAQEAKEGVAKGTQRGIENIKENTQNAVESITNTAKTTRGAADDLTSNAKQNTREAGRDLFDKAEQSGEKTSNFVQEKLNQAGRSVQRNLDKAGDAVDDAVD